MATYSVTIAEAASAGDSVTARMVSDAQFAEWLRADNRDRVVLVEAGVYTGGAETTRYLSNRGYTTAPGESPANTAYEDIVLAVPEIRSSMREVFAGRSLISYGEVDLDNSNGVRDAWLGDAWDKRDIAFYLGDPAWQRSDFRLVFKGIIEDIRARNSTTLTLKIRDRQSVLDKPLQTKTIAAGALAGKKRPVCYGKVYHAEAPLSDASLQYYEVHDGTVASIDEVHEDGATINPASVTRLPGGSPTLGAYFTYTGHLAGFVAGRATFNATGWETKTGDIVKRILIERAGLTESQIDPAAITAFNSAAGGNPVGFFSTEDDETVGSALDTLMAGIGGYYSIDRDGRFTGGVLGKPSDGNSILSLTADDIEDGQIELVRRIVPPKTIRLGYERYWATLQALNTSSIGNDAQTLNRLRVTYKVVSYSMYNGAVYRSLDEELQPSCFADSTGANAELARRYQLWYDLRYIYRVRAFTAAQTLKLGDCITLTLPRNGFDAGVKVIVVGMRESVTSGIVELEVFK